MSDLAERFRLTGRVAVITGAGKGIGAAIAATFAEAGADVALTSRTAADLESVAAQVRSFGRRALVMPGDVNDVGFLAELVMAERDDRDKRRSVRRIESPWF